MSDTGPPPGTNYLAVIEPSLTFALLGAFFGGLLVPLSIFLFLFSNPVARRHPVFILNLAIIILGLALAAVNVGQMWSTLVTPYKLIPESLTLANIALDVLSPMIIDSVLIFRLLAFYPRMTTPRSTFFAVLAFPVVIKSARFICVTIFLHKLGKTDGQGSVTVLAQKTWFRNPYLVSEWSLQIADNLYCTSFFFWKLRRFYMGGDNSFLVRNKSLLARLRGIFAIALANFVFPLFMNVTQLILIINDTNYARGAETLMANMYVSIFGVLFATVWASGNAWGRNSKRSDQSAFETTFSESPGYVGSGTDPRLGSKTRIGGSHAPKHYNVSFQGNQSGTLAPTMTGVRDGIHVEQVVLKDIKSDDYSA
ncbi:hypothetical protein H0H87_004053 [Tephrocybe sp. NHM501043]|nr:hypothetical protein H0H87_004053 [Tephrocybe sp. NHM501043]